MVEMEVRDADRIDPRPVLVLAKLGEHAGAAVERTQPEALDGGSRIGRRRGWARPASSRSR